MKKVFLISVLACLILMACSEQKSTPAAPSATPKPISTSTHIATSTPIPVPPTPLPPTSTVTPFPFYQNKKVIFDYYEGGDHSIFETFFAPDMSHPRFKLVLYDDGQLIIHNKTYEQKFLSPDEIKRFMSKLEALGFYSIESNQKHDPTDKLYNYGNNYQRSYDGLEYCISVETSRPRILCAYEPDIQYLIPKMKNILRYLDEYEPVGMTPYYPDRIFLWVQEGRDPYSDNPSATAIPWDEKFPSLETSVPIMYVDGDLAKEIYLLFGSTSASVIFTQNGKEYTVYIDVLFPQEKVTNAYQ